MWRAISASDRSLWGSNALGPGPISGTRQDLPGPRHADHGAGAPLWRGSSPDPSDIVVISCMSRGRLRGPDPGAANLAKRCQDLSANLAQPAQSTCLHGTCEQIATRGGPGRHRVSRNSPLTWGRQRYERAASAQGFQHPGGGARLSGWLSTFWQAAGRPPSGRHQAAVRSAGRRPRGWCRAGHSAGAGPARPGRGGRRSSRRSG